jgi:hypothetical protein
MLARTPALSSHRLEINRRRILLLESLHLSPLWKVDEEDFYRPIRRPEAPLGRLGDD